MDVPLQEKHLGFAIFRVPTGNDEWSTKWRNKIVDVITRDRVVDKDLKRQIESRTLHTCELHYTEDMIIRNPIKTPRVPGAIPPINLPVKSPPPSLVKVAERSTVSIAKRLVSSTVTNNSHTFCYKSYDEFCKRILSLKFPNGWTISKKSSENIRIYYSDDMHLIPHEIYVNISLSFQIRVYCWLLPTDHIVYSNSGASM